MSPLSRRDLLRAGGVGAAGMAGAGALGLLWNAVLDDAGGTLPGFGPTGVISG